MILVQQRIDVILADIRASMADLQARLEAQVGSDDEEEEFEVDEEEDVVVEE